MLIEFIFAVQFISILYWCSSQDISSFSEWSHSTGS